MNSIHYPVSLEIDGNIIDAAEAYERYIDTEPEACRDAFVNLSFLYWQSTEFGFNAAHKLPSSFIDRAAARYAQILQRGIDLYPTDVEFCFWQRYFDWASIGQEFTVDECELYIEEPDCVVPYFFVRSLPGSIRQPRVEQQLRTACEACPTLKNRYILSVLNSHAI